ncbi:MAG: hypothetical protein DRI34_06915 [Deltaproteobacteria bacterium]|nr:MAG: hypothetical protein DRI34_06915 [Deltaproteobacteria bacterium]
MPEEANSRLLKELKFQLAVTRAMLGTLDLDQVLYIILSGITHGEGLGFNRAFLFLSDEGRRELKASTAVGPASDEEAHRIWEDMESQRLDLPTLLDAYETSRRDTRTRNLAQRLAGFSMPLSASAPPMTEKSEEVPVQAIVARCAGDKKAFHSNTIKAAYHPPPAAGETVVHFARLAAVPLMLGEEVIGVILADNLYDRKNVDEDKVRGLTTLANLAAIAIERARLHRRIQEMASLDGLTGVANRRHYEKRLEQEIARARRTGRALSLMVFDIDNFKNCNDSHGHECGDLVLKDLASFLRARVRAEDLVARYGGEEFVVLLTGGASGNEAYQVADKLRQYIASQSLGGRPAGEITVSVGAATLGPEDVEGGLLFRLADQALYQAKQQGRNRAVMAQPE